VGDRDALLAAILAQPDEDAPRLVYADWLDEHDESERAEFIRIQHRLPHLPRRSAEAKRLAAREAELRGRLFEHLDGLPFTEIRFARGFVESVASGLRDFSEHAAKLRPEDAPAFALVLRRDEEEEQRFDEEEFQKAAAEAVAERSELRRCISLDLPYLSFATGAEELLGSPNRNAPADHVIDE
jgi:uncharacterized protein (TIGR02996 family)